MHGAKEERGEERDGSAEQREKEGVGGEVTRMEKLGDAVAEGGSVVDGEP